MNVDCMAFLEDHLWGEARYLPDCAALAQPGGVARPCRHEPAAFSRLARLPQDDTLGQVQLPDLG